MDDPITTKKPEMILTYKELNVSTWSDFEKLFGPHGAYGGCWCMFFRGTKKDWNDNKGEGNRLRLKNIVEQNLPVGLIAYIDSEPVGWCAVAPRSDYDSLVRSKYYQAVDESNAWAITCFYTNKSHRREGVSSFLIQQAIIYSRSKSADFLEAFPIIPRKEKVPDIYAYTGIYKVFSNLGFIEVLNRDGLHPIVRYDLSKTR